MMRGRKANRENEMTEKRTHHPPRVKATWTSTDSEESTGGSIWETGLPPRRAKLAAREAAAAGEL